MTRPLPVVETRAPRTAARNGVLLVLTAALVAAVLGVQLASGGGNYTPAKPQPPCTARRVTSVAKGLDGLTEKLVLLGLDRAACRLGITREAFTLQLAQSRRPSTAEVNAIRAGLLDAIGILQARGQIPPAADLTDEALDDSDLPGFVKYLIRHLPDSVINNSLHTDDVLRRTVRNLDLRRLLANLDNSKDLQRQIGQALTKAIEAALLDRLKHLI